MSITYHNPENLTDWGQSDGWRIRLVGEPLPEDAECFHNGTWIFAKNRDRPDWTYRTKKPLPVSPLIAKLDAEIKARQELRDIALAVEAGAEWEVDDLTLGFRQPQPGCTLESYIKNGWKVRLKPKPVTRPSIEDEVINLIQKRREAGLAKYGVSMDRKDLNLSQWAQHAIEEALDLAIYLTKFKQEHEEKTCNPEGLK